MLGAVLLLRVLRRGERPEQSRAGATSAKLASFDGALELRVFTNQRRASGDGICVQDELGTRCCAAVGHL